MVTTPNPTMEKSGYFLVNSGKKALPVTREFFETVEQFLKPNNKLGIIEVTFKNGGVCAIKVTQHIL
jgi:hypothetical protein